MTTSAAISNSLKQAVEQVRMQHVAAVNAGDVEAATRLFAPDGVFLPPGQSALEGTAAIQSWFTQMFAAFQIHDFGLQPAAVAEHGEIGIEHGSWRATFTPRNASTGLPAGGTYLTVYARLGDGSVRMIRDTFNGLPGKA